MARGERIQTRRIGSKSYDLREVDGPGKLEGGLMVDSITSNSEMFNEEAGDVEGPGFYGLVDGGIDADTIYSFAREEGFDDFTDDEIDYLGAISGAIVFENSNGFVWVTYYDTTKDLERDWQEVLQTVEKFEEEVED